MSLERRFLGKTVYSPAMAENLKKVFLKHQEVLKLDNRIRSEHVLAVRLFSAIDVHHNFMDATDILPIRNT